MPSKLAVSFLLSALAVAPVLAQPATHPHTVPEAINCGPDILIDDFTAVRRGVIPGEGEKQINLLGGDYGLSGNNSLKFEVNPEGKYLEITPLAADNYFFAKFDAGACYDLTNIHAVAFDLTAPAGATFDVTLTQKMADCSERVGGPNSDIADSNYVPLNKYVTPNGQKQSVVMPFFDHKTNHQNQPFDFVHLKDWTPIKFRPLNAVFRVENLRLIRACNDNGPTGKNATVASGNSTAAPVSSAPPTASSTAPLPSATSSAPAPSGTSAADSSTNASGAMSNTVQSAAGAMALIFAAVALL